MMEELFIPEEQSLKLRNLGFNELCLARFDGGGFQMLPRYDPLKNSEIQEPWFSVAPTWSQAFDWFRGQYSLHTEIRSYTATKFTFVIQKLQNVVHYIEYGGIDSTFNKYEEARLACLDKLIEICTKK